MNKPQKTPSAKLLASQNKPRNKKRGATFSFIIIIFTLAAAFWFGWIQFRIREGEYAVVYTKSHGYEENPVPHGQFAWRWHALLPTNLSIHRFKISSRTLNINQSGSLPSSEYYTNIAGRNVNFNWKVKGQLIYRINPKILPSLVKKNGPGMTLESYYENFEALVISAVNYAVDELLDRSSGETSGFSTKTNTFKESVLKNLSQSMAEPQEILISDIFITQLKLPNLLLYVKVRETAHTILENRKEVLLELQNISLREKEGLSSRLELLEEYGNIITKYPALIDLFALEGNPASSLLPPPNTPSKPAQ